MAEEWTYDLFVSYVEADKNWVEGYLLDALDNAKIRYTLESAFALGVPCISEFERAIRQSRATLLVISETYLGDDTTRFTDILAQSYGEQVGTWPVIPLTLQDGLKLPPRLGMLTGLKASNAEEWDASIDRLCHQLKLPPPPPPPKPACPYPGMRPFSENDEGRFFGRDGEIDELLNRLRLEPFLTVIGASGSGKSSLVFAGLIPKLKQSGLFGTGQWCIRSFRPGTSPLTNLQAVLGGDATNLEARIEQLLSTESDAQRLLLVVDQFEELFTQGGAEATTFQEALLRLIEIPDVYLILTVRADFYPDLMGSLLWEKMSPHRFEVLPLNATGLKQAIVKPAEGVDVYVDPVLVERLLVDAKGEPGVLPLIQETLVLLWEKLKRRFLPFNAYELLVLSRPDYGATPNQPRTGLQVAIARRADAALADLGTEEKRAIARRIFLRLIQFGEGRPDTRRQQLQKDLHSTDDAQELFNQTIEHLAQRRLLTFSGEEGGQKRKVDIAHEALISGWPTLGKWIEDFRKEEQTRRRLESKAQDWLGHNKKGGLLDEVELRGFEGWLNSDNAKLVGVGSVSLELIKASKQRVIRGKIILGFYVVFITGVAIFAVFQRRNAEIGQIKALSESSMVLLASHQGIDALVEALKAANQLNSIPWPDTDTQKQVRLALQQTVYERGEKNRLEGHSYSVRGVSFSPDGTKISTASEDYTVRLWSIDGQELDKATVPNQLFRNVTFNSDSTMIAAISADNTIKVWRIEGEKLKEVRTINGQETEDNFMSGICFIPKTNTIAASGLDITDKDKPLHVVNLWDINAQKFQRPKTLKGHNYPVWSLSCSSDGKIVTADQGGFLGLWHSDGTTIKEPFPVSEQSIFGISFSPDGTKIAIAGGDTTVKLWNLDLKKIENCSKDKKIVTANQEGIIGLWSRYDNIEKENKEIREPFSVSKETILGVNFSPNGKKIASVEGDITTVQICTLDKENITTLGNHNNFVTSLNFSRDGKMIASTSADNTVKLWSLDGRELKTLQGHGDRVYSASFSPDGNTLASAGDDNTVKLWSIGDLEPKVFEGHDKAGSLYSVSFNPTNSNIIASAGDDNTIIFSDLDGHQVSKPIKQPFKPGTYWNRIWRLSFSPDGQMLASANYDKTIQLWSLNGQSKGILEGHDDEVIDVSFSPKNPILVASASYDGTVKLWRMDSQKNFKIFKTFNGRAGKVRSVSFSPDGQIIASAHNDGTIKLWQIDGAEEQQPKTSFKAHDSYVTDVLFSRDGKIIASASRDKTIKLWSLDGQEIRTLKGHIGEVNRLSYSRDGKILVSASTDHTIRLWSVENGQEVRTIQGDYAFFNVSISPDNTRVVGVTDDALVEVWNVEILDVKSLREQGCKWLYDHLNRHSKIDKNMCKGIQ
jgi:WD40 repeat protein